MARTNDATGRPQAERFTLIDLGEPTNLTPEERSWRVADPCERERFYGPLEVSAPVCGTAPIPAKPVASER